MRIRYLPMKKALITLSLALASTGAVAGSKSGFAIGLGMVDFNGDLGKSLSHSKETDDKAFNIQADYTFENGVIIGGMYSPKKTVSSGSSDWGSHKDELSSDALYMGYQFDSGIRVKLGSAAVRFKGKSNSGYTDWEGDYVSTTSESYKLNQRGLYLGLGWVTPVGIYADISYTKLNLAEAESHHHISGHYDSDSADGGFTQFTLGYKF